MVSVQVEILGHFAELAGRKGAAVEIDTPTVAGLLAQIRKSWSHGFIEAIWDRENEEPTHSVVILANGKPIYHQDGLETKLAEGDRVTFLPPIAGGDCVSTPQTRAL
jgi:MoaD family protein